MRHDARGIPVSSGSERALARYETALVQLQTYVGDPVATIDDALAESPDFVAGHLMKALTLATYAERQFAPAIGQAIAAGRDTAAAPTIASAGCCAPRGSSRRASGTRPAARSTRCSPTTRATRSRCRWPT